MVNYWFYDSVQDVAFEELYDLGEVISKGGSPWVVHKCLSKFSARPWSVKILYKKDEHVQKKVKVGQLIAIQHPNLVRVKEIFETPSELHVVVQYDEGDGDLFDKLANRETYSEFEVAHCVIQILQAVKYLHIHDITHGNLKPENLMYKQAEIDKLIVLVSDYAVQHIFGQRTVQTVNVCTATDFCAPEILKGKKLDKPVDLWAVGILTYILLCGYEPFRSDIEAEKFKLILKCDFTFDPFDWADVTDNAKDFVRRLLSLDAKRRPTATQALQHRWLNGAAPQARQLEAAPNRLKQFTNKRLLKLSTEIAKPFTAQTLSDTFPRHYASLEHLMEPASACVSASSSKDNISHWAADGLHDAVHPAGSTVRAVLAARDPHDKSALWPHEDAAEGYEHGQHPPIVEVLDPDKPICSTDGQILMTMGLVFGEPLPFTVPSDGNLFLSEADIDQVITNEIFPQQLPIDSELFAALEPVPELETGAEDCQLELPPDMPFDMQLDMPIPEVQSDAEPVD